MLICVTCKRSMTDCDCPDKRERMDGAFEALLDLLATFPEADAKEIIDSVLAEDEKVQ